LSLSVSHATSTRSLTTLFRSLSLIAEVYHENRTNIVQVRQDIPSIVGLTAGVRTNYGEAVGKGLDLTLNYNKAFANSMWYIIRGDRKSTRLNSSHVKTSYAVL